MQENIIFVYVGLFLSAFIGFAFFIYKIVLSRFEGLKTEFLSTNKESEQRYKESLFEFQQKVQRDQFELQSSFQERIGKNFDLLNEKVSDKLNHGFDKNHETIKSVVERLSRIDEAQKKIEQLSQNVVSLQDLLSDKKSRGIFGEVQLSQLVYNIFGDSKRYYELQYTLSNKSIVDCMLFLPEPLGYLAVDSKFPLENFQRLQNEKKNNASVTETDAQRAFKKDLKKHIDDIAGKYIIKGETSDQAVMFIPAEAIFAEVHAFYLDVVDYAYKKKVWLASPTTMMAILSTVQVVLRNQEQSKYAHVIQDELRKLGNDFRLYKNRWDKLVKHMDTVGKDVKEINTSSEKITKKFESIVDVKLNHDKIKEDSAGKLSQGMETRL